MGHNFKHFDLLRRRAGPAGHVLMDAWLAGRIDRRTFLRAGSVLGLTLPLLATRPIGTLAATPGGTLRIGQLLPQTAIEPLKISETAGILQLSAVGEYLCLSGADMALTPMLAESWSPNNDGTVWTFKLRRGVKFHSGRPMTAEDVVATFDRLADPDSGSNALTLFAGTLSKGGARQMDNETVEFHLDAPHGNFPYLVSSNNYNAVILPADYRGDFETNYNATGPFRLEKYTPRLGAAFVRNDDYWGARALPDRLEYSFFADLASQIHALEAGEIDILQQLPLKSGPALAGNAGIEIVAIPSTAHHQIHMRCDMEPFRDPRVRRAVALCLDRPALVKSLTGGQADIGNDSPFAPAFPSTDRSAPQRVQDLAGAKRLMAEAGLADGFSVRLPAEKFLEVPELARAIQEAVKIIGGRIDIEPMAQEAYFGDGVFGKSPWLDSAFGITDYDHRGLPNVCLTASLRSDGAWNAAHYRNRAYDGLAARYIAALDIDSQRRAAAEIQKTLLADTPVIFAYFHKALTALRRGVSGVRATAEGHLFLAGATAPGKAP